MDNLKGNELGRRSLRIANGLNANLTKPLGVFHSQASFERKSVRNSLPRKSLFEPNSKENEDFALCKEFTSNRENTGKSPVVVHKIRSSIGSHENKKVKPRRSMLGLRSKTQMTNFVKDDTTFTVSKPLLASSPNSVERIDCYNTGDFNLKLLSQRSLSTPQLTPFDSDDADTSAFFNKGISDSTWSVFKSVKKKSAFEKPITRGSVTAGKARLQMNSLVSSVDKEVKLKWLAQNFQMEEKNLPLASSNDNLNQNSKKENSANESSSENGEIREDENCLGDILDRSDTHSLQHSISSTDTINYNDQDDMNESFANSTDSYIQNETTILNSGKNNLEKIEEENNDSIHKVYINDEDLNEKVVEYDEAVGIDINRVMILFEDLKNEKEDIYSKLYGLMAQKEIFEKKWNALASVMKIYSENSGSSQRNSMNFNSCKKETNKVINTKLRHSLTINPEASLTLPKSSSMRPSNSCSDPKKNFNRCKTPVSSDKKLKRFRKSLCYTPNTLSIKVDDQAKDIFGDV